MRRKSFWAANFLLCAASLPALATQSVSLAWDSSVDSSVVGYIVHYGAASGVYTNSLNVGTNISATVPGLQDGATYYFAVTDYNSTSLESSPSNEVSYQVPIIFHITGPSLHVDRAARPGDPTRINFLSSANQSNELQASEDLRSWTTIWTAQPQRTSQWLEYEDADAGNSAMRFYRLVVH